MRLSVIAILSVILLASFALTLKAFSINITDNEVRVNGVVYEHIGSSPLRTELPGSFIIDGGVADIDIQGVDVAKCNLELTWYEYQEGDASFYTDNGELKSRTHSGKPAVLRSVAGVVPMGVSISFDMGSGDVRISGMQGAAELILDAGSGDLIVENSSSISYISIDTGSGEQTLQNISDVNSIVLDVGSGDIDLEKLDNIAKIDIDSGSGDTVMRDVRALTVTGSSGSGEFKITNLKGDLFSGDTSSGDIRLTSCDLDRFIADTGSGDVDLNDSSIRFRDIETGSGVVRGGDGDK